MTMARNLGPELRFLDPADAAARQAWDEAANAFTGGSVFHTSGWLSVIEKGLGKSGRFAYLAGTNGSVRALVPLFRSGGITRPARWLNLPQSCAADPLAADEADAARLLELVAAAAAAEGAGAVVLKTPKDIKPVVPEGWEVGREAPTLRHVLDLSNAKDVATLPRIQVGQKRIYRRVGRRLAANGTQVRVVAPEETALFTRALHHILLRRHGHLGPPKRFFDALFAFLPGSLRLLLACPQSGPPLAFSVMVMNASDTHTLWGSGFPTSEGTDAYRYCVGQQIEAAIQTGRRTLDFGESGPHQEGLIYFKETWGSQRVDGSYQVLARKGADSGLNVLGKNFALAQRILRHAPVGLSLRIAGPVHKALQ
jgi:hypothetical protein